MLCTSQWEACHFLNEDGEKVVGQAERCEEDNVKRGGKRGRLMYEKNEKHY